MSIAATKAVHPSLAEVRENDGTAESIREAFFRLDDARAEANAEIARLAAIRPSTLLSASASEIDKADEKARRLRIFIEQLDLLEPELKTAFVSAKIVEQDAEYSARLEVLTGTITAWNDDVLAHYLPLASQIVPLLERERVIRAECAALRDMPTHQRAVTSWSRPEDPAALLLRAQMTMHGGPPLPASLAEMVRLPGLEPGGALWGGLAR